MRIRARNNGYTGSQQCDRPHDRGRPRFIPVVSPYLRINDRLRRTLEVADSRGVKTFFVYGKKDMDSDTYEWIKSLRNSSIGFIPQLHAKMYVMELAGVIMSMNLYTYSQVNNEELGVIFEKKYDRSEFKGLVFHATRLIDISRKEYGRWDDSDILRIFDGIFGKRSKRSEVQNAETAGMLADEPLAASPVQPFPATGSDTDPVPAEAADTPKLCHCIRCGRTISSEHPFVYCGRCLESWKRFSNISYSEPQGHCYICNAENRSSADRPACIRCYSAHKAFIRTQLDRIRLSLK